MGALSTPFTRSGKPERPLWALPNSFPPHFMPRKAKLRKAAKQYWIGYPRKSTDTEDKQVHSIGDQKKMIENHYHDLPEEERRHRPLKMLPESESAFKTGRPIFGQIMNMADEGKVHGLIAVQPNRISRNHADSGRFMP